jgi:hypothetical protein
MSAGPTERNPHDLQRDEITPWIEVAQGARLNAYVLERLMPPQEGSELRPVPEDPLKNMAWSCHGFLEAAADHLVLWADYAAPLKFHPEAETTHTLRPVFTLARAAIEGAAQAIWVLSPKSSWSACVDTSGSLPGTWMSRRRLLPPRPPGRNWSLAATRSSRVSA